MATPIFRASQSSSNSPFAQTTITLPRLEIKPQERFDPDYLFNPETCILPTRWYGFTHLTIEDGGAYTPTRPTVRWFARMVAFQVDSKGKPIRDGSHHWFSIHLYWDVVHKNKLARWNMPRNPAIAYESHARVCEYLMAHPYPSDSEDYDPIVLEVW